MASDNTSSASRLDVSAFAKSGSLVEGEWGLPELPRLAESVNRLQAPVRWSVQGSWKQRAGQDPEIRLALQVLARVELTCQRCLSAMDAPLSVNQVIRFVRGAELAEQLDEASEDEDVLELPRRLNLCELIEDELILALPLIPRHEQCPATPSMRYGDEGAAQEADLEPQAHPFAALAALRSSKPQS